MIANCGSAFMYPSVIHFENSQPCTALVGRVPLSSCTSSAAADRRCPTISSLRLVTGNRLEQTLRLRCSMRLLRASRLDADTAGDCHVAILGRSRRPKVHAPSLVR